MEREAQRKQPRPVRACWLVGWLDKDGDGGGGGRGRK
jgi:hypothetical protein